MTERATLPACYICGEDITLEQGLVQQPHEGPRHPTCDPQTIPPETPAIGEFDPLPPSELARAQTVHVRAQETQPEWAAWRGRREAHRAAKAKAAKEAK